MGQVHFADVKHTGRVLDWEGASSAAGALPSAEPPDDAEYHDEAGERGRHVGQCTTHRWTDTGNGEQVDRLHRVG